MVGIEAFGDGHTGGMAEAKADDSGENAAGPRGWLRPGACFVDRLARIPDTDFDALLAVARGRRPTQSLPSRPDLL